MTKGKSKSAVSSSVKAAIGTAALLAGAGAYAKGLRESGAGIGEEESVVASVHISSKQGLNDEPPPNLTVAEKEIAETAPFQMIRQERSMEEYVTEAGNARSDITTARRAKASKRAGKKKSKKKSKRKSKRKSKKHKHKHKHKHTQKLRQLGMEPPEADDNESSEEEKKGWKRFRWI